MNILILSVMGLTHWAGWGGWEYAQGPGIHDRFFEVMVLLGKHLGYGALVVGICALARPLTWRLPQRLLLFSGVSILLAYPRALLMELGRTTPYGGGYRYAEWILGASAGIVALTIGNLVSSLVQRVQLEASLRRTASQRAAKAIHDLQTEEIRIRRMVSDQLHGTLQFRLVTVAAELDGIATRITPNESTVSVAAELRALSDRIEEIRELDVRSLSHSMLPSGVDLGTVPAIQSILSRVPADVATSLTLGPTCQRLMDEYQPPMPMAERLVIIYAVEEAVSNALRHGHATSLKVYFELHLTNDPNRRVAEVVVDDNGTGVPETGVFEYSGLSRHLERLEARDGTLNLISSPGGGARLRIELPVTYES
ncbi:MAG: hypothetical protein FWD83_00865 [Promicromonosporaceae bacterium]|nr:hypothetical protein [Promicromonosporaceae bacterium]